MPLSKDFRWKLRKNLECLRFEEENFFWQIESEFYINFTQIHILYVNLTDFISRDHDKMAWLFFLFFFFFAFHMKITWHFKIIQNFCSRHFLPKITFQKFLKIFSKFKKKNFSEEIWNFYFFLLFLFLFFSFFYIFFTFFFFFLFTFYSFSFPFYFFFFFFHFFSYYFFSYYFFSFCCRQFFFLKNFNLKKNWKKFSAWYVFKIFLNKISALKLKFKKVLKYIYQNLWKIFYSEFFIPNFLFKNFLFNFLFKNFW